MQAESHSQQFFPLAAPSSPQGVICVHVERAGSGWELFLQSGATIACVTGISLADLLSRELAFPPDALARIDGLLLDGKPVDNPKTTIVPDGARLALAAGMPGIGGAAMRSNSAVRGLRSGITWQEDAGAVSLPGPGYVELALLCLALPMLGRHVLAGGVLLSAGRLLRCLRPALRGECVFEGTRLDPGELRERLEALPADAVVRFSVCPD